MRTNYNSRTLSVYNPVKYKDYSGDTGASNQSSEVIGENDKRTVIIFQNVSNSVIYLNFGDQATVNSNSIKLSSGDMITFSGESVPENSLNVISTSENCKYICKEG